LFILSKKGFFFFFFEIPKQELSFATNLTVDGFGSAPFDLAQDLQHHKFSLITLILFKKSAQSPPPC